MRNVQNRLNRAAKARRIRLEDLASRLEISRQWLNKCIKEDPIDKNLLYKICNVLDIPVSFFESEKELPVPPAVSYRIHELGGPEPSQIEIDTLRKAVIDLGMKVDSQKELIEAKNETIATLRELITDLRLKIDRLESSTTQP